MKLSMWQVTTVFLAGVVCAQWLGTNIASPAQAAPGDIHGSPLIPVTTYHNVAGNFVVWADGHITKADQPNNPLVQLADYAPAPSFPRPTQIAGRTQGSPNVPAGAFQDDSGSYVIFADGTTKKPSGAPGSSGTTPVIRKAFIDGTNFTVQGDPGISVTGAGITGQYWVNFSPPFQHAPICVVSASAFVGGIYAGLQYPDRCKVFTADFAGGTYRTDNLQFNIIAVGD